MKTKSHQTKAQVAAAKRYLEKNVELQEKIRKVMKIHENRRQLDERAFYPDHPQRTESPEYKKTRLRLVRDEKLPCIVCGVTYETLKDPKKRADPKLNPYGATQLETHHHVVEWALANAIDADKFNQRVLPHLRHRYPDHPEYKKDLTPKQVTDWIDHHEHNLWVLCDVHHRHKWIGIHAISFPIWGPQDLLKPEFVAAVEAEMKKNQDKPKKKTTKSGKRVAAKQRKQR